MVKGDNAGVPRSPSSPHHLVPPASSGAVDAAGTSEDKARQRAAIRDTQIRRNASCSLARRPGRASKTPPSNGDAVVSGPPPHTVAHYELGPIETIPESNTVLEAVRHMVARHLDSLLVLDVSGTRLRGIITDRDVTFRVLATDMDPRTTTVAQVMTPDPRTIPAGTNIIEALTVMVANHFRHLPVVSEGNSSDAGGSKAAGSTADSGEHTLTDDGIKAHGTGAEGGYLGVLDIAKCLKDALQKLELADAAASQIASAMDAVRAIRDDFNDTNPPDMMSTRSNPYPLSSSSYSLEALRERLACPQVSSLLRAGRDTGCTVVSAQRTTVQEAVRVMARRQHTAAVVVNEHDHLVGIFTTKDVLLRVIAAGLDPAVTSIVRVMTPHPAWASPEQSIISALRQMHLGRFLHLPVVRVNPDVGGRGGSPSSIASVSAQKSLLGVVDVLQLTYAMLEQLNQLNHGAGDASTVPLWHQLWSPSPVDGKHYDQQRQGGAASELLVRGQDPPVSLLTREEEFTNLSPSVLLKICREGAEGMVARDAPKEAFLLPIENVFELPRLEMVLQEACARFKLPGNTFCRLALVDEDGDVVPLEEDEEFIKVVQFAMGSGRDRVTLALLTREPGSGRGAGLDDALLMRVALAGLTTALLFALGCWFLRPRT